MEFIDNTKKENWGRSVKVSKLTNLMCLLIFTTTPLMVGMFIYTGMYNNGFLLSNSGNKSNININLYKGSKILFRWILFQVFLYLLPDQINKIYPNYRGGKILGSISPKGNQNYYQINGLQAWLISYSLFFILGVMDVIPMTIIYDNWVSILVISCILSYILTIMMYIKGLYYPSSNDNKYTGNWFYDLYMGIELNPKILGYDLKLFLNGRPGIIGWSCINLSFAAAQYQKYGYISNSMFLVNFLQFLYIGYFFYKEAWYLETLDISLDHFGWMFSFGDLVWLPAMYTLQCLYLVSNPIHLTNLWFLIIFNLGILGFIIFVTSNNQKENFKKNYKSKIWGQKPYYIDASYIITDKNGKKSFKNSKLLLSGWWVIGRHMNYTGDLILSLCYSLPCGFNSFYPYFYFFYLMILLIHRCIRDEYKCSQKYGTSWDIYCNAVPYRLIPYIW